MVATTIGRLREQSPDAAFTILSYYPDEDRRLLEGRGSELSVESATPLAVLVLHLPFALACWVLRAIGIRLPDAVLPPALRRLRASRALFDVSGISFHDGRLAVVAYNALCILPALLLDVPVLHLSQARGPFRNPVNRLLARHLLGACRQSFARGSITAGHMAELGLPAHRWSLAADVAFSFQPGDSLSQENDARVSAIHAALVEHRRAGRTVVALSPSSVVFGKAGSAYVDILARAAAHLGRLGHHVLVLPNATRAGSTGPRNNDLVVIAALRRAIGEAGANAISWVDFDLNTDSIRRLIGTCDLLITSRFHAMVAGLALCVPTFVIGWSHKYAEVLEQFGCAEDSIDFAALDQTLLEEIDIRLSRLADTRARICQALPTVVASSRRQFELISLEAVF